MNIKLPAAALLFLLIAACERSSVTDNNTADQSFTNRNITQQYIVPVNGCMSITNVPGNFEICLDSVPFDNRCPPNVYCFTAGNAICRFLVKAPSVSQTITLHTTPGPRRQWEIFQMRIVLDSLLPYSNPGSPAYNDYKAYLNITRL